MKTQFLLEEIPKNGLELDEELDRGWVEDLLLGQYISGNSSFRLTGTLRKDGKTVFFSGRFQGVVAFECSRCAEDSTMEIDVEFTRVFFPAGAHGVSMDLEIPDDNETMESVEYRGNVINLGPTLTDEFVLMLPAYPLCSPDCKGLCPVCGHNLNQGDCGCDRDSMLHNQLKVKPNLV